MRTLGELNLVPVWVNAGHRVDTARMLTQGHHLRALAVMEGRLVLGVVTTDQLSTAPADIVMDALMQPAKLVMEASTPIHKAAQQMHDADVDFAVVMDEDLFIGMVTSTMLLRHLLRPWDARTNLGSGERLREWGIEMLREGREISILFFDLNDFKHYNREYGHVFGDKVLRRVANLLRDCVDPKRDLLVRYGGDEFAIGSVRERSSAEELAHVIKERAENDLTDENGRPITFCIGVSGGRRSALRDGLHPDATYDDLVTAASKACMAAKEELKRRRRPAGVDEPYEDDPEVRR